MNQDGENQDERNQIRHMIEKLEELQNQIGALRERERVSIAERNSLVRQLHCWARENALDVSDPRKYWELAPMRILEEFPGIWG